MQNSKQQAEISLLIHALHNVRLTAAVVLTDTLHVVQYPCIDLLC